MVWVGLWHIVGGVGKILQDIAQIFETSGLIFRSLEQFGPGDRIEVQTMTELASSPPPYSVSPCITRRILLSCSKLPPIHPENQPY